MILRSLTCFSIVATLWLGGAVLSLYLPVYGTGLGAMVSGHVQLVFSNELSVRQPRNYSGVVVWLEPLSGLPVLRTKPTHVEMIQKDKTFSPHVLPIMIGTTVDFPNYDPIFL